MLVVAMASKSRRKKFRRGEGAMLHDLCFAANIRKTMQAIYSGLECVEQSGRLLQWMALAIVVPESRVDAVNSILAGSRRAIDERGAVSSQR
jgi:hypothetical protein